MATSAQSAFAHLVGATAYPEDPHAADSVELAHDILDGLGVTESERTRLHEIAEYVAGNYEFTGKASERDRKSGDNRGN